MYCTGTRDDLISQPLSNAENSPLYKSLLCSGHQKHTIKRFPTSLSLYYLAASPIRDTISFLSCAFAIVPISFSVVLSFGKKYALDNTRHPALGF